MPARLGGVDRGDQWYVEEFGQRDRRVGNQPVVGVYEVEAQRSPSSSRTASPARIMACPIARIQAIMSEPNANSWGSWAAATTRTPSLISSVDGCVLGSVSAGGG